jgi:hypothetical protein
LDIPTRTSTPVPDDNLLTGQSPRQRTYSESTVDDTLNKTNDDLDINSSYHGQDLEINIDEEPVTTSDVPDAEMLDDSLTKP